MIKKNTNFWLSIIILGLLLIIFLGTCKGPVNPVKPVISITSDTVYSTTTDTFWLPQDTIYLTKLKYISSPNPIDSSIVDYKSIINDSLITAEILTSIKADGTLINQDFKYIPKFPKYIHTTDSVTITNNIKETIIEQDWGIYGGVTISPYKQFALIPTIGLKTKKDMYIGIGYDPFNQNAYGEFKIKIFGK